MSLDRDQLQVENVRLVEELELERRRRPASVFELVGNVATTTSADTTLRALAIQHGPDTALAIELGQQVELRLRRRLQADTTTSFFDLLAAAREGGVLSKKVCGLAHALRTLRNVVVHLDTSGETQTARSLLALLIACLVKRDLPTE